MSVEDEEHEDPRQHTESCRCSRVRVRALACVVRDLCDSYWVCLCASACVCEDVHKVVMNALRRVSV